ncbi:MAG: hypothetical protein AYK19_13765 [Theionarchaea archaeon DG-70-1]|nr:MAG: hypothetical protein AYK19_13765 [Theionarchaea archaeon DG-70-1]
MPVHVTDIPVMPESSIAREFKRYIESIHPRYDWRDCLDILIEIHQYITRNNENPSTTELVTALQTTGQRVRTRVNAMEPRYAQVSRSVFIVVGEERYSNYYEQRGRFGKILGELKHFLEDVAPRTVEPVLLRDLTSRYDEILSSNAQGYLYEAVNKYHDLIQTLDGAGVKHNPPDVFVQVDRRAARKIFIIIGEDLYFGRLEQQTAFNSVLIDLRRFMTAARNALDSGLFGRLNALYNDILARNARGDLYGAVRKYHDLIWRLNNAGEIHDMLDAQIRSTAYRYELTENGENVYKAWERGEL